MDWETEEKSEWINLGAPVAFGETTGWIELPLIKQYFNSSGYARIDYRALDADTDELLQYMNSKGTMVDYSDYWTGYVGRAAHHILAGTRSSTTRPISVNQFYAQ
ncbi:MAG: hypothetical protein IJZ86_03750 [Bacteroides sp.]|nr:hypothetical protein [Bacteroides sp.]